MDCCKAEPLLLNDSSFADTCFVKHRGRVWTLDRFGI